MIEEPWIINLNRLQDKDLRIRALETRLTLIPPEKIALKNQAAANRVKVEKHRKLCRTSNLKCGAVRAGSPISKTISKNLKPSLP